MKRIIPFFAVCLALSVFQTDVVNAATNTKRDSETVVSTTRSTATKKAETTKTGNARSTNTKNTRTTPAATTTSGGRTVAKSRTTKTVPTTNTKTRTAVFPRNIKQTRSSVTRNATNKNVSTRNNASTRKNNFSRATKNTTPELNASKIADIKSRDYSKCKTVYYDCMDEFCANKDADLRRCACSTRNHEFDKIKKQLNDAEDKMLDFNQQLLLVGLDKEDALAVNTASEGELGFQTTDSSTSEKLLKKISKNLNTSNDSKIANDLSSVSLSLDLDSAWDSVSALSGISTTSKSGIDLYNAAQPVCIEMAQEVCSNDELEIAKNSYQLLIQQDCNTVAKSYDSKYNQAMEKIHESGALLDMARLNAYQERNSDDILTCKQKILDKLYDSAVCGSDLHKCLDITGQYINPADGNAFLSVDLYNITTLLTAPTGTSQTWSKLPQNNQFVSYINSKKKFLDPATEQCQDIADTVWKEFLDDALAQIKLAQNAKLEQIRQSCTTLVSECKTGAQQSLENFDARALSTFEVIADTTVNALCTNVETSCRNLLNASGGGGEEWSTGITEIAADISYESILETCMTVGKDCIIQQCNGTSGNFALCGDYSSNPRRAILKHNACWNEVRACVEQSSNLANITPPISEGTNYYNALYGNDVSYVDYGCGGDTACLLTEQIWGNCEYDAENTILTTNPNLINGDRNIRNQNKILTPIDPDKYTLLSWFAFNTGTSDALDSCSAYYCPVNYQYDPNLRVCKRITSGTITTDDGEEYITTDQLIYISDNLNNYCAGGRASKDIYGNCCASGRVSTNGICVPEDDGDFYYNALLIQNIHCEKDAVVINNPSYYCENEIHPHSGGYNEYQITEDKALFLYCVTTDNHLTVNVDNTASTTNSTLTCNGHLVLVDQYGNYMPGGGITGSGMNEYFAQAGALPYMSFKQKSRTDTPSLNMCKHEFINGAWLWMKYTRQDANSAWNSTNQECQLGSDDPLSPAQPSSPTPTIEINHDSQFMITY